HQERQRDANPEGWQNLETAHLIRRHRHNDAENDVGQEQEITHWVQYLEVVAALQQWTGAV
ncbi:MAG: hypothetical protein AAFQ18_00335, partial [Pseudomonadota bacterium]